MRWLSTVIVALVLATAAAPAAGRPPNQRTGPAPEPSSENEKVEAMVGPATKDSIEIGLNAKDLPPHERLKIQPPGGMCQATTRVSSTAEIDANLIVMGTHGRGAFQEFLVGSITLKVVHLAKIPVLLVK